MSRFDFSRRAVTLAAARFSLVILSGRAALAQVADRGIGGTGAAPGPDERPGDRGIGGTGVIGTIRGFGSIIVNGLHIAYGQQVPVVVDDDAATAAALKVGQVVHVTAVKRRRGFVATRISIASEVVGPVEAVSDDGLVVMGQRIEAAADLRSAVRVGDRVAVSGLRRGDGAVVASLIEPRAGAVARVWGLVRVEPDGSTKVGNLGLRGLDPTYAGQRCLVVGDYTDDELVVTFARSEQDIMRDEKPVRLIVEAFVSREAQGIRFGSGLRVRSRRVPALPVDGHDFRAIVALDVAASGNLVVRAVTPESHPSDRGRTGQQPGGDRRAPVGPQGQLGEPANAPAAPSAGPVGHPVQGHPTGHTGPGAPGAGPGRSGPGR